MAVTLPTVDDFTETTVLTMIRKVVDYLCSDSGLVAQINNNDITGFTSSYTNNVLKIDATKGDGTTIPVCNLTIEGGSSTGNPYPTGISGTVGADGNITFTVTMSSGNPLTTTINMNYFASAEDLSDLQEQVSGITPTVTVNDAVSPPTITVAVNGKSSTTNLPNSGSGEEWEEFSLSTLPTDFKEGDIVMILFNSVLFSNSFTDDPGSINEIFTLIFYLNGQGGSRTGMLKTAGIGGSSPNWSTFSYDNYNFQLESIENLNKGNERVLNAEFTRFSLKSTENTKLQRFVSENIARDTNVPRILKILRKRA